MYSVMLSHVKHVYCLKLKDGYGTLGYLDHLHKWGARIIAYLGNMPILGETQGLHAGRPGEMIRCNVKSTGFLPKT